MYFIMLKLLVLITTAAAQSLKDQNPVGGICISHKCVLAASDIALSIDDTADPCNDFYQFACGKTIESIGPLPDEKASVDQFTIITDKTQHKIRVLLEEPIGASDSESVKLAKKYYKACTNKELINSKGKQVIESLLKELGGWPVLEGPSWKGYDFISFMHKLREKGLNIGYFFAFSVVIDTKNSSIRSIEIDQPANFGLTREFLEMGLHTEVYHKLMVDVAVELGANRQQAENELKEALDFEIALAKLSLPSEKRTNYTLLYNPTRIDDLQQKYPGIDWLTHINNMLPATVKLSYNDSVVINVPDYIRSIANLIELTPKRVQANYVLWRVTQDLLSYLSDDVYKHYLTALTSLTGSTKREKPWKECIKETYDDLSYAVASLYVRNYFDEESKTKAEEIVKYIKEVFLNTLKNLDWMDDKTRERALEKAQKIEQHIGYPVELLDDKVVDDFYKGLSVNESEYLHSYLKINKHATDFAYGRLFEPVNRTDWKQHGDSYEVGAFYYPSENSIQLPAGILQGTFFNKNHPMYMNFAAIGSVVGHEITHGFDNQGRQLNANGGLDNWWEADTEVKFLNKTRCIIDQYGSYFVKEVNNSINGLATLAENIADNAGIKQAYIAYNNWVKANGNEQTLLPGLLYTPHQIFWISAAKNWCAKYRTHYLELAVASDVHSPNPYRVLGPFSNSEEFSRDFRCPRGSNYNPDRKCSVW